MKQNWKKLVGVISFIIFAIAAAIGHGDLKEAICQSEPKAEKGE